MPFASKALEPTPSEKQTRSKPRTLRDHDTPRDLIALDPNAIRTLEQGTEALGVKQLVEDILLHGTFNFNAAEERYRRMKFDALDATNRKELNRLIQVLKHDLARFETVKAAFDPDVHHPIAYAQLGQLIAEIHETLHFIKHTGPWYQESFEREHREERVMEVVQRVENSMHDVQREIQMGTMNMTPEAAIGSLNASGSAYALMSLFEEQLRDMKQTIIKRNIQPGRQEYTLGAIEDALMLVAETRGMLDHYRPPKFRRSG
ncbi:hypothetical protein GF380_05875 [Candidatus Uhrbacteria bacterium]|nr:hypothetical protein [Candidatus Uhrbacteria bacterium]MBD3284519.1 hypothetical protein [Candidatus Uhrbacteria bacterium]